VIQAETRWRDRPQRGQSANTAIPEPASIRWRADTEQWLACARYLALQSRLVTVRTAPAVRAVTPFSA
jgi:hypothetical protein